MIAQAQQDREAESTGEESAAKASAARLSIYVAVFLISLKTFTGFITGSISVWASLLDSAMDALASLLNFIAVRASSRPPDEDHLYGHGKAESLAGLFQAGVISVSGLFLVWEAIKRIIEPYETSRELLGVGTMIVAALVSLLLFRRLRRIGRETDSPALQADAMHYATDVYTNGAALAALLIVRLTNWTIADPLISIVISLLILRSAFEVGRDAVDVLMDRRLPEEFDLKIADIIANFEPLGVRGFHDLRTRRSGAYKFIDLHLEVESKQSLVEAHDLTVKVIRAIQSEIPRCRVQVHTDPVS